jgi:hypothetical protein
LSARAPSDANRPTAVARSVASRSVRWQRMQRRFGRSGQAASARHGTAPQSTTRHGTAEHDTARHRVRTARHRRARHGTAEHDTAPHGTASAVSSPQRRFAPAALVARSHRPAAVVHTCATAPRSHRRCASRVPRRVRTARHPEFAAAAAARHVCRAMRRRSRPPHLAAAGVRAFAPHSRCRSPRWHLLHPQAVSGPPLVPNVRARCITAPAGTPEPRAGFARRPSYLRS